MSAVTQHADADRLEAMVGHQVLERGGVLSPYVELDRATWARLRENHPMSLTADDVTRLRGLGDPIDMQEIEDIYLPISRLLNYYVGAIGGLHDVTSEFLGETPPRTPFVIGVAGSVAVGKSTTSRILRELLSHWPDTPRVQLVTTDGFLFPNAELERRNLMARKGFPESYDRRELMRFVAAVKSGVPEVTAPIYSHLTYDIVPDERIVVRSPDVLIVEGLNVLQPPGSRFDGTVGVAVNDYFDFTVYVDAETQDVERWYVERFLSLRETAFADPDSYFHRYAVLSDEEARSTAARIWREINGPNLVENILPTRSRATLVLVKGPDHSVEKVRLRKL
jgi:type I pantothenate kinase